MKVRDLSSDAYDKMAHELKAVIKDAEELLRNTDQQAGEGFKSARARFEKTLKNAKVEMKNMEENVVAKVKDAAHTTDVYVKGHPWSSLGLGAGVSLLVGMLVGRKCNGEGKGAGATKG